MSGPKNMNARERARLAAEQAAARKRDRRILIMMIAAFVVILVAGGIAFQAWRTNRAPSAAPSVSVSASRVTITNGRPIPLGSAAAPVTITLYEDFHCPHCADFEEQFGSSITQAQEAGAARLELYPMAFIDEGSLTAANAMACAAEAGFGQAYYLGLFANHTLQWSDPQLIDLATKVNGTPPSEVFKTCVTRRAHADWVTSINAVADTNGVAQTPTILINGKEVDIATLTPESLKTMINDAAQK
ncbi:MAG TPA: thioredoxin domain-containing protein [Propionibacteriaceae bacterium]|nr:thioredoxin domain-containing protein [Propionibacteriaceae bacterium]